MSDVQDAGKRPCVVTILVNQIRVVYSSQLDALVGDFTTALGVRRKLQDILEQNYEFFNSLRNNVLELIEIANLLTELGFQSEAGGAVKAKSVQSALARAAKRARNYSTSNIIEARLETASDRNRLQQASVYGIKLHQSAQNGMELQKTATACKGLLKSTRNYKRLGQMAGRTQPPETKRSLHPQNGFPQNVGPLAASNHAIGDLMKVRASGATIAFAAQLLREKKEYKNG